MVDAASDVVRHALVEQATAMMSLLKQTKALLNQPHTTDDTCLKFLRETVIPVYRAQLSVFEDIAAKRP